MESYISQIRDLAAEESDFAVFREKIKKIDDKFVKVFFTHNFDTQAPEHVFRAMSFARPEMTIEQKRMRSPTRRINKSELG
jgi:hypothetical protein